MSTDRGPWCQTYTGVKFYYLDIRPDDIRIEDIAHSLSNLCRFTGHVKRFLSVAEHCFNVSLICNPEDALPGLLHDAPEAYLNDLASPLKYLPGMEEYRRLEAKIQGVICEVFGLKKLETQDVIRADKLMLNIEARDLLGPTMTGWIGSRDTGNLGLIRSWSPEEAERAYLQRFHELRSKNGQPTDGV